MSKLIMHIDMDAFFASIEQQVNPCLKGKPVIVGGRNNKKRSVVCAASYEAKAYGIESGMPSWKACKLCPDVRFVPAESSKYVYTSYKIFEILNQFTPEVEMFSVDEFFLEFSGRRNSKELLENISKKIKDKIKNIFGLTCSIGIAPSRLTAKLAAKIDKPDGLGILEKDEVEELLKDLPVEKLCGIGSSLKKKLNELGIRTCGDLRKYPLEKLVKKFGKLGVWFYKAARGEDFNYTKSKREDKSPKSVGHSYTFKGNVSYFKIIKSWMRLLSEMVGERLRNLQLKGRTVHLSVKESYQFGLSKQKTFSSPTNDGYEIFKRTIRIFNLLNWHGLQFKGLGIVVSNLHNSDQINFLESKKRKELINSVDGINRKFGEWTIFPANLSLIKNKK